MEKVSFFIGPKKLGLIIIGISIILFLFVLSFTQTLIRLRLELHKECPLPIEACPYKSGVPIEAVAGFTLAIGIGIFGLFLILGSRRVEGIGFQQKSKFKQKVKSLQGEEEKIYQIISDADGSIFQSDIVNKTGFSKVKVSRILDRLETKGIVERRRRGMSNLIVLKD
ncbi:MAG: helix-turn-helix transcriptional regulator [Methanosarcinales archaeon]